MHSQTQSIKPFDLRSAPLTGVSLIEASAGTGKTYTIEGLYLRLILEKGLCADQILVVTFTRAATAELKDRIRKRLIQAKEALKAGWSDNPDAMDLIRNLADPPAALERIKTALMDFDRAAIMTLHGFCQRVLNENAFETSALFDVQLAEDQSALLQEVAEDFWRIQFYSAPLEWAAYAVGKLGGPGGLQNLIRKAAAPGLKVIPEQVAPGLNHIEDFRQCFNALRNLWPKSRMDAAGLLADPALSGTVYGSVKADPLSGSSKRNLKIGAMLQEMDLYVSAHSIGFPISPGIENFSQGKIQKSTRKGCSAPTHSLFELVEELWALGRLLDEEMAQQMVFLKSEFIEFSRKQLEIRKKSRNTQFFDDLLLRVHRALRGPQAGLLAGAIQEKYRAALVDEFQDTDPIQYEIFSTLFGVHGALYMIGDPKQAIYGFRGADIFAYMKAALQTQNQYTLTTNWRSSPRVIAGVNAIFSGNKAPFVFDAIGFHAAKPAPEARSIAHGDGLVLWFAGSGQEKPLSRTDAVEMISQQAALEISNLLSDDSFPFKARDIAVLVRTNRQAKIVKRRLDAMNIPAVLHHAGNIFDAPEAAEIERVLRAALEPRNERQLRAALATHLIGESGRVLDRQAQDNPDWEKRRSDFAAYFEIWNRSGFIRMFRRLLVDEKVKERLLAYPDGERRMTNVLHLMELLHQASVERHLGMRALVKWLARQRDPSSFRQAEAHQLRLESDRQAVCIVTIHKSKGLEYPVVFCPFCWDPSEIRDSEIVFHDSDKNLVMDIGTGDAANLSMAQDELLSENLRLLYVALTRAKHRCYAAWGRIQGTETSALAYLLHSAGEDSGNDRITALKNRLKSLPEEKWIEDLQKLVQRSSGGIELALLPIKVKSAQETAPDVQLPSECLRFTRKMDALWKISSYSSWVMGKDHARESLDERPDRDPLFADRRADVSEERAGWDIFSFPKGTRAGLFFHEIFEHLDFTQDVGAQEQLVVRKLSEYGFDASWLAVVCDMLRKVLAAPLKADLRLSDIGLKDRINEMEFYYPIQQVRPEQLAAIFAAHGNPRIPADFAGRLESLQFSPAQGLMKGFVDLVFRSQGRYYLVDWKSNFLGNRPQDYDSDALAREMSRSMYVLQYQLYTLALASWLEQRVENFSYERDFGGVFYIFIRGVDPALGPGCGVFHDLPSAGLVRDLKKALIADSKN